LFPIMELGTSAKMLSIVPLMAGGGMYETGAGGSAPKHVQAAGGRKPLALGFFGRVLGFGCLLGRPGHQKQQCQSQNLAKTLDAATGSLLANNKNPSPKTGELDNRGSQFYLAMYWAQELAAQTEDKELQAKFAPLAKALSDNEKKILDELKAVQGKPADIGGYYKPSEDLLQKVMCPSQTFNTLIQAANA